MKKGSTPTLEFSIPLKKELISKARILFGYGNLLVLKIVDMGRLQISDNLIKVKLSQEETFLFMSESEADVQLRVLTPSGDSLVSDPLKLVVEKCMDEEVFT